MNDPGDESNNASGHPGLGSNLPEYQQRIGLEVRRIFHGLANYAATIPGGNRTIDFTNPEVVRAVMQMADFSQTRNAGNGGNLSALQQQIGSELRRIYNGAGPSHASPRTGASASDLTRPELVQAVLQMAANQAPASHQHAHSHSHTQPHMTSGHHSHHNLPHHSHSHQPRVMNSGVFGAPPGGQTNIRMEAEPDENQNDGGGGALTVDGQPDWRQILKWCQLSGPFVLLISIKLLYDHRLGLLLFACLMGTFYYTNRKLELEIYNSFMRDNRQGRSKLTILGIILLLLVNTAAIYFVFSDQELYKSLYFQLPLVDSVDLWNLAWILVVTDFVLKFGAIVIKGLVSLLPRVLLSHNKRGKYYMFLEQLSQLYRGLVPIRPWLHYLSDTQHGGQVVSTILLIIYTLCKANLVYKKLLEVKEAFKKVRTDMVFGQKPSREDLKESGDSCPICQDDYREPVQLSCRHIFCEDCVSIWFDREKTCPMCRAQIADNPLWRDGSTSSHVQWY